MNHIMCPISTCHACDEVRRLEQEERCPTLRAAKRNPNHRCKTCTGFAAGFCGLGVIAVLLNAWFVGVMCCGAAVYALRTARTHR